MKKAFFIANRIANVIGAILFGLFAFFQVNDDDPLVYDEPSTLDVSLWIAFYALISIVCIVGAFRRAPATLLWAAAAACLFQMAVASPGVIDNLTEREEFAVTGNQMNAANPEVEQSREFFGASIALAAVCAVALQRRLWKRPES